MDTNLEVNNFKNKKRHLSRLILSCAIGGSIGHLILYGILIYTPELFIEKAPWLTINVEILQKSALLFAFLLLSIKFLSDFYLYFTRPKNNTVYAAVGNNRQHSKIDASLRQVELAQTKRLWSGFRPFIVEKKEFETPDKTICSFYLKPYDQQWLPPFNPGQYLTFRLDHIEGQLKSIIRCYSLSDNVNCDYYRVTIKRISAPPNQSDCRPGLSSNHFHDFIKVGDVLDVKAPSGHFYLNNENQSDVVLIAGGVGFTPMISILNTLLAEKSQRDIWFFYGVRNSEQHAMKEYLENIVQKHPHVHLIICYSSPMEIDEIEVDYQVCGRVTVDLMKQYLPSNNFEFYLCGPGALMIDMTSNLKEWGVPDKDVYFEAFGPASVPKIAKQNESLSSVNIRFDQSEESVSWDSGNQSSLLDAALTSGVDLPHGCRMGNCGTCETELLKGDVSYPAGDPGFNVSSNHCLPCVCVPLTNIVLNA